jgi:H+/Cl- antiporter ClcA
MAAGTNMSSGLPVAPSLEPTLQLEQVSPRHRGGFQPRLLLMTALAVLLGVCGGLVAQILIRGIALITNLSFFGRVSTEFVSPAGHPLGAWVILIPAAGGLVIGLIAYFGSPKVRGHGIPEAMEQVLFNRSRIPVRMTFLKPLSAAISIGTGGPYGAEGPIIATGGALGSLIGQLFETTAIERKTLLAAGAAAGLTGTFGNPISSTLLAVELLLFEFSPRSLIPVAMACSVAAAMRVIFMGSGPAFVIPPLMDGSAASILGYILIGLIVGAAAAGVTTLVSWLEHQFEKLPIPWIFHPALGGLVVGVIGWKLPHTMGPGYDSIEGLLSGHWSISLVMTFLVFKFISWCTSVSSGTSGGTLAPMFAIGGCLAMLLAFLWNILVPGLPIDPATAALVGMAALFAGASRAFLASALLAIETTHSFPGLLPVLAGCTGAYLVSGFLMKHTIMTEKFVKAGAYIPEDLLPDALMHIPVSAAAVSPLVTVREDQEVQELREWLRGDTEATRYQAFPVLNAAGKMRGFVMRRELTNMNYAATSKVSELRMQPLHVISPRATLREAIEVMQREKTGRLIVNSATPAILTRRDIHAAYRQHHYSNETMEKTYSIIK